VRVAADADVAVRQQQVLPATGAGHRVEDVALQRDGTAAAGQADRGGADVDAEGGPAGADQGAGEPTRTAADVEGGAGAPVEERRVAGDRVPAPGGRVEPVLAAPGVACGEGCGHAGGGPADRGVEHRG